MSDEQKELETTDDAEFAVEDSAPAEKVEKAGTGNGVAWLAVLLAALALIAVLYTAIADWRSDDESTETDSLAAIQELELRVRQSDEKLADIDLRFEGIQHPDFSADIGAVRRDVGEQRKLLDSLPARMSAIEGTVASLAGISAGARETFLLAEAEYYLQIANAQLQLANNPTMATLALRMADERATQISDPALTDVRRAISDELAALEVMKKPDLEGATLALASLARVVESLPLAGSVKNKAETESPDPDESGVDRAWGSVKDAMSGLVKVTPPDQAKLALVSPDSEYFLRNNIALQLQSARLALLRGEQAIFEQTLDDASALLETYFDADSAQVNSALQTIAEIRDNVFTTVPPDIAGSLRKLRQYRTLRETGE